MTFTPASAEIAFVLTAPDGARKEYDDEAELIRTLALSIRLTMNAFAALDCSRDQAFTQARVRDMVAEAFAEGLTPDAARLLLTVVK